MTWLQTYCPLLKLYIHMPLRAVIADAQGKYGMHMFIQIVYTVKEAVSTSLHASVWTWHQISVANLQVLLRMHALCSHSC